MSASNEGKVNGPEGFERAFEIVGGNSKFQWVLLGITSLQLICLTWNHIGYIFIGAVPQHWCKIEELQGTNWTLDQIKELAIPRSRLSPDEDWKYEECVHYDLDFGQLLAESNGSFENVRNRLEQNGDKPSLEKVKSCSSWEYDDSIYASTVASDFNLVCGRRYLTATIQSSYMIGGLAGTFTFGALNDRILGRRKSALISICLVLLGGFLASLSTSYWVFVSLRLLIAFGTAGCMQAGSTLLIEHCDIKSRAKFYSIAGTFFGVGYGIMPLYAYYIRDWSSLQLAFSSTTLILLSYFWIFPESPRWLASMGQDERAVEALEKMAKRNGRPIQNRDELLSIVKSCHKNTRVSQEAEKGVGIAIKVQEIGKNFKSLLNTREACRTTLTIWALFIIVAFVYYGFAFSTNLTSNPYLIVSLGGLMEIPACIVPIPFLSLWGRRWTTFACLLLTGVFAIAIAATPPEMEALRVGFTMGGKFFVAAVFNVIYLVVSEVYPTVYRTTGQAASTIMGRFGSIVAPYVADLLTSVYPDLPCVIFGIVSMLASAIALLLPEMKGKEMMDRGAELELLSSDISNQFNSKSKTTSAS